MKNKNIVFGLIGVVLFLLVGFLAFRMTPSDQQMPRTNDNSNPSSSSAEVSSGKYLEHTSEVLTRYSDKRRVLYFYANWCPTCIPADKNFKANSDRIPDDVTLIRVNYNDSDTDEEEKQLANQYGITYQHTFVQIDESGTEVAKWNGGQITELLENIK